MSSKLLFSTIDVTRQVFYRTSLSFALVNLKPIVPGHVLVASTRPVPRLSDLDASELASLISSVQRVGRVIEGAYGADSLTVACQDGPAAGQSIPHVHFHLLPRKRIGDPFSGRNDEIYPALERAEGSLPAYHQHLTVDADENRVARSIEDMVKEAEWLKAFFADEFLSTVLDRSRQDRNPADRPFVTLTFAQSLDAKIAGVEGQQLILSCRESMVMTHWMRTMHDAILIGIGTALYDNPQLNVRYLPPSPENRPYKLPRPIVLDPRLRLDVSCKLLQNYQAGSGLRPWIMAANPETAKVEEWIARRNALETAGAKIIPVPVENGLLSIPAVLRSLREQGIQSLMVEGGARVINSFLRTASSSMVDTVIITVAPQLVGERGTGYSLSEMPKMRHARTAIFGTDTVVALDVDVEPSFESLLDAFPPRPVDQQALQSLVDKTLKDAAKKSSTENRKAQWEYLLRKDIFDLAATEGTALNDEQTTYYDDLRDKLDLILIFTEHEACEQTFPFLVLQDLLETQTIDSCSHIFSWIESRSARLTEGLIPQKGKALVLLRTLNDLLRRLSKMGSTTIFCGRILTFLSSVFPLGERSGVNLRGEYGPAWEGVKLGEKSDIPKDTTESRQENADQDKMQVDDGKENTEVKDSSQTAKPVDKREDFYNTFWSLQSPFSRPPLFALPDTFNEFKEAVGRVLPVIKEATAKERAMMGSRSSNSPAQSLKRKRESESADEKNGSEYFFAKFLTSPDLLDLEIADTHFRRQFLFQLLILLNHLLTFTKTAKATWSSPRNRSLQMEFTLDGSDIQWVQETLTKTMEELRQTTPNGRIFAETVNVILEREKNWVKWKNELCAPFDKEPWSQEVDGVKVSLEGATKKARDQMRENPKEWDWKLGSQPLTEIWEMGYRDLSDLQNPFQPGEVKDFVKKVKQEEARIDMRKKALSRAAERAAAARAKLAASQPAGKVNTIDKDVVMLAPQKATEETPAPSREASDVRPSTPGFIRPPVINPPLHPSLPPKPGSPTKPQEPVRPTTPAAIPVPPPPVVVTPSEGPLAPAVPPVPAVDDQVAKLEENKQRWSWLCLRVARDQYLQHFGKIGTGDIVLLAEEIEKEKRERDKVPRGEDASSMTANPSLSMVNGDDPGGSTGDEEQKPSIPDDRPTEGGTDRDVKMDDGTVAIAA